MRESADWFRNTKLQAEVWAEAYRLRLIGRLWWANLAFVVLPSVLATLAAIFAAKQAGASPSFGVYPPLASLFAGGAAVLSAVHKSLKCDEYQAECLRLIQEYKSIAALAGAALAQPDAEANDLKTISNRFASVNPKAPLPNCYIKKAEKLIDYHLYGRDLLPT